ncbi:MAG: hypothetical protein ACFFBP_08585 [Promethearchaeota archaeon]
MLTIIIDSNNVKTPNGFILSLEDLMKAIKRIEIMMMKIEMIPICSKIIIISISPSLIK